jgi:hypothetical protein
MNNWQDVAAAPNVGIPAEAVFCRQFSRRPAYHAIIGMPWSNFSSIFPVALKAALLPKWTPQPR